MGLSLVPPSTNVHCVRRCAQRNILGLDHTTSFNRPVLQIIHSLMNKQHMIRLNMIILHSLITSFQRTKDAKYSHPILVTHLCGNCLPDEVFSTYDRVFVAPERITSVYNNCLHVVWTHSVQPKDNLAESFTEELSEEDDEPEFWRQPSD